jgi:putative membrane protein
MQNKLNLYLKGLAMGVAEVIPGVSGGTIAFITGIYEKLLFTIKTVLSVEPLRAFRAGGFSLLWTTVNGPFLLTLLAGMATGLIAGVFGITTLLEHYPPVLWAFFFGLIVASSIYIGRQVGRWTWREVFMVLAGIGTAYILTAAAPLQGSDSLFAVFLSGAVAICALILPGISGSFMLLLLGMYTLILTSVRSMLEHFDPGSVGIVVTFAVGCLTGLALFSRFLSWTMRRYPSQTLALLTGFMVGSLNKLWPWRNPVTFRMDSDGIPVPLLEENVLPGAYQGEPFVAVALLAAIAGFAIVFVLERLGKPKELKAPI